MTRSVKSQNETSSWRKRMRSQCQLQNDAGGRDSVRTQRHDRARQMRGRGRTVVAGDALDLLLRRRCLAVRQLWAPTAPSNLSAPLTPRLLAQRISALAHA
eukprot:1512803-Rhodomonas_salina.6